MPKCKDIRSYFTVQSKPTGESKNSSNDISPIKRKKKVAVILDSDSDDEKLVATIPAKKAKLSSESDNKVSQKKSHGSEKEKKLVAADPRSIFGIDRAKRSAPRTSVVNKTKPAKNLNVEEHSDEDFENTLKAIDKAENDYFERKNSKEENKVTSSKKARPNRKEENKITSGKKARTYSKEENTITPSKKTRTESKEENTITPSKKTRTESKQESEITPSKKPRTDSKEENANTSSKKTRTDSKEENKVTPSEKLSSPEKDFTESYQPVTKKGLNFEKFRKQNNVNSISGNDKKSPTKSKSSHILTDENESKLNEKEVQVQKEKEKTQRFSNSLKKDKMETETSHNKEKISTKNPDKCNALQKQPTPKVDETSPVLSDSPGFQQNKRAHYISYLQRGGPKHLGEKELPKGNPNCLSKLTFVITGVLDSLEREEAVALIQQHGGKVTSSLSRNTSYIIVGNEAGPTKLEKAKTLKTPQLDEDGLLNLIRQKSGIPEGKNEIPGNEETHEKPNVNKEEVSNGKEKEVTEKKEKKSLIEKEKGVFKAESINESNIVKTKDKTPTSDVSECAMSADLWVDKYSPKTTNQIIGQQGDKSNVKKLIRWLKDWHINHSGKKKTARPSPWSKDDSGAFFKAALLSGPPGVGKTTTAHLVCKELGYDIVEYNASDTRSKTLLHDSLTKLVSCRSLSTFFKDGAGDKPTVKHVLLMDEVDGMAGNEDRGGMQEFIQVIKNSQVPIICMCNDRHHPKIRSLVNYCFDLHFNKPRIEQIKGGMMSVCFKEGIKISPEALNDIITASNHDIRQTMHHLFMFSIKEKQLSVEQTKQDSKNAKKIIHLGPWDVLRKVFSAEEHKHMSLHDKTDLFFHDYSLGPLFVHENYLNVRPHAAKPNSVKALELMWKASDSICMGDVVDRTIRSSSAWNLLPVQAVFSSILPGEYMEGHLTAQINFPAWLGKNSRFRKFDRLLQELQSHMRLRITGNKESVGLEYLKHLRQCIVNPLATLGVDGVHDAVEIMKYYCLTREDLDSILEMSVWPNQKDPMSQVDSKVKAAFTRLYNKEASVLPYSTAIIKKAAPTKSTEFEVEEDIEVENEAESQETDDISSDAMIKAKKRSASKKKANVMDEAGPSKSKKPRTKGKSNK